jgi:hypothetical protein
MEGVGMRFLAGCLTGVVITVAIPILWVAYINYTWSTGKDARMWYAVTEHYRPARVSKNWRIDLNPGMACFDITLTEKPGVTAQRFIMVSGDPDDNNWRVDREFSTMADCKKAAIG